MGQTLACGAMLRPPLTTGTGGGTTLSRALWSPEWEQSPLRGAAQSSARTLGLAVYKQSTSVMRNSQSASTSVATCGAICTE